MDKETLSSYGWVIVIVLVLSIIILTATPFGERIMKSSENIGKNINSSADEQIKNDNPRTKVFEIAVDNSGNGTIALSTDKTYPGDIVTFTITENGVSQYDGLVIKYKDENGYNLTKVLDQRIRSFTMFNGNITVSPIWI